MSNVIRLAMISANKTEWVINFIVEMGIIL